MGSKERERIERKSREREARVKINPPRNTTSSWCGVRGGYGGTATQEQRECSSDPSWVVPARQPSFSAAPQLSDPVAATPPAGQPSILSMLRIY